MVALNMKSIKISKRSQRHQVLKHLDKIAIEILHLKNLSDNGMPEDILLLSELRQLDTVLKILEARALNFSNH